MSVEQAKAFYDRTNVDPKLYDAVRQTREVVVQLARTHGYEFTYEELNQALAEKWGADFEQDNPNPDQPNTCSCF